MNVTMDTRHSCWRCQFSVKVCLTLILLMVQIYTSTSHGHSANPLSNSNSPQHFSSSSWAETASAVAAAATTLQRRDIASISVTEVNRSRNLRQTYENSASKSKIYNEIHPAQSHHHFFSSDIDNNVERNSTDNRKPAFYACKDYAPKVKEEQPSNTFVIRVDAEDPDESDTITYSFEKSANERAKFHINEKTGDIETSYTFDRDEPIREKEVSTHTHIYPNPIALVPPIYMSLSQKPFHTGNCTRFRSWIGKREVEKKRRDDSTSLTLHSSHMRCAWNPNSNRMSPLTGVCVWHVEIQLDRVWHLIRSIIGSDLVR